jgi:hypothetical protein
MGHDAWVVGNEIAVAVDFDGMIDNAKRVYSLLVSMKQLLQALLLRFNRERGFCFYS